MSLPETTLVLVVLTVLASCVALVVRSCATGGMAPNHLVGLRVGRALSSDEAWRAVHRAALGPIVLGAALMAVACGGLFLDHYAMSHDPFLPSEEYLKAGLAAFVLSVVVGTVLGYRAGEKVPLPEPSSDHSED